MTGGLIQIASFGEQDLYLTSKPEITFFKYVYKKYTKFSIETIPLKFDGEVNFDEFISCEIPNNGDLIKDCCINITLPEVNLQKSTTTNTSAELTNMNNANTKISNFNSFIDIVFNSVRLINKDINKDNITLTNLRLAVSNYLNNDSILDSYISAKNTQ